MSLQKMLEYQKIDAKIYRLEKDFNELDEKKEFNKYQNYYKEQAQIVTVTQKKLDKITEQLSALLKKAEELNSNKNDLDSNQVETFADDDSFADYELELKDLQQELNAISDSANDMQKKLAELSVKNKTVLNNLVKSQDVASKLYGKIQAKKRNMKEMATHELPKLKQLRPDIEDEIFKMYETRRNHHIFPIFMPYNEPNCSACGIDVKAEVTEKFKAQKFVECPHCRRLLYKVEDLK